MLQSTVVPNRLDAFQQLGTPVSSAIDAESALAQANLAGWNVRKLPLLVDTSGDADSFHAQLNGAPTELRVDDKFATVRTNPETGMVEVLGVVGNHYRPIQNEANAELLNLLVDESGAEFETAGALRGGRETYMTMRLPDHIKVGGFDPVGLYLAALNSHDGTSAMRFLVTPVRIECKNTQAAAIRHAVSKYSITHTANATQRLLQVREALRITFDYVSEFEAEAERMIAQTVSDMEFERITKQLWGITDLEDATSRQLTNYEGSLSLWRDSATLDNIRGTAWGAYQVFTEYLDHFSAVSANKDAAAVRAQRAILSDTSRVMKEAAFEAFSSL